MTDEQFTTLNQTLHQELREGFAQLASAIASGFEMLSAELYGPDLIGAPLDRLEKNVSRAVDQGMGYLASKVAEEIERQGRLGRMG